MAKKRTSRRGPSPVIKERLAACRGRMKKAGLSAFLVTNRPDQVYLTGFTGEDGGALITTKDVHLLTDGRFATSRKANIRTQTSRVNFSLTFLSKRVVSLYALERLALSDRAFDFRAALHATGLAHDCLGVFCILTLKPTNQARICRPNAFDAT